MLGKTLIRFIISHTFIVSAIIASTENVKINANEEQKLLEDNPNQENLSHKPLNEEITADNPNQEDAGTEPLKEADSANGLTNDANEDDVGNEPKPSDDGKVQSSSQETQEEIKKFIDKKAPLWKIKSFKDKHLEPGFDLTLEEMKKFKIWENGVIPYYIDVVSFSDKVLRDKIRNYLHMVNSVTSLNFVELSNTPTNDSDRWVFFMNRRGLLGCADHTVNNFTNQGVQHVVLGYDCIATKGEMAEAVMSIVGVPAQHNAPDRDQYIKVHFENIMPDKKYLFKKIRNDEWLFHDLDYDFHSITHYDIFKYSASGRATIQLKDELEDLNPAKEFSTNDFLKIKMLYNYITMKANLKSSKCDKLFKPRSKFERFVPIAVLNKPRKKPSRYSGLQNDNEKNNEKEELNEKEHLKGKINTDGENILSKEEPGLEEENIKNRDEGQNKEKENSHNDRNKRHTADEEIVNSDKDDGHNEHKENLNIDSDERDKENKKVTNKEVNDGESNLDHREELKAKKKFTVGKKNALSLLSDYYSDF